MKAQARVLRMDEYWSPKAGDLIDVVANGPVDPCGWRWTNENGTQVSLYTDKLSIGTLGNNDFSYGVVRLIAGTLEQDNE